MRIFHLWRYFVQLVIDRYYWRVKRTASPARCSRCWKRKRFVSYAKRKEILGEEKEVSIQDNNGLVVHGIVREVWDMCPVCESTVWGGFDETVDGINWAPLNVFYGLYDELCEAVQ